MDTPQLFQRYQDLQRYVGWTNDDAVRVSAVADLLTPLLPRLVEDFYAEIERHPEAQKVITGGAEQISRLKHTLLRWLQELLSGRYDSDYVARRWRVGDRHVEIGLDQVYTNVALSRLRTGLQTGLQELACEGQVSQEQAAAISRSLDKLLDLDLAIIEDAYQAEYHRRRQQAEKLATIGQVAGGVAHELRNPLNVIKTSVYYLLHARNPSSEKRSEHLGRIEKQVGLADGVITALSNFAKLPVPNLQAVSVEPWIRDVLETLDLPKSIEVNCDFPANLPPAWFDPEQMPIVLRNLLRNAHDAMPQGGEITVRTFAEESQVAIAVVDTGQGITLQDLGRIMEPLFTTKARGIGLGLAMAKAIVEKNNGRLSVASELERGTTFTIQLSAAPRTSESIGS